MLSPGQLIDGKYRILNLLGEGGMGLVYVADHERLARQVALKVVRTTSSSEVLERFKREAQALARVNSPYVAEAFDADVFVDGTPYLVMELLQGRDLRMELRQRGPLPIGEAVAYVVQSCRGVAAAHRAGIVHRDLKPHNLFLTRVGDLRRVKVVDFGIAKFMDAQDGSLTNSMMAMGTPLYMSPEHIRDPRSVSTPADVWALGVILYELLAGFSPFADASTGAIVAAITLDDPPYLRRARPDVPEALARVVHAALLKDREQRMPSADAFAEALKPFALADEALTIDDSTFRQGPPVDLPKPLTRHLAQEVRREIARHVESQSGEATAREGMGVPSSSDGLQPGEETALVPSLGLISVRPPAPSGAPKSDSQPAARVAVPVLDAPARSRRPGAGAALLFIGALVLAALGGHFLPARASRAAADPVKLAAEPAVPVSAAAAIASPPSAESVPIPARVVAAAPEHPEAHARRPPPPRSERPPLPEAPPAPAPAAADGNPLHL